MTRNDIPFSRLFIRLSVGGSPLGLRPAILLAQVLAGLQSPIAGLIRCLAAPMQGFARVLQARIEQLEGE